MPENPHDPRDAAGRKNRILPARESRAPVDRLPDPRAFGAPPDTGGSPPCGIRGARSPEVQRGGFASRSSARFACGNGAAGTGWPRKAQSGAQVPSRMRSISSRSCLRPAKMRAHFGDMRRVAREVDRFVARGRAGRASVDPLAHRRRGVAEMPDYAGDPRGGFPERQDETAAGKGGIEFLEQDRPRVVLERVEVPREPQREGQGVRRDLRVERPPRAGDAVAERRQGGTQALGAGLVEADAEDFRSGRGHSGPSLRVGFSRDAPVASVVAGRDRQDAPEAAARPGKLRESAR